MVQSASGGQIRDDERIVGGKFGDFGSKNAINPVP